MLYTLDISNNELCCIKKYKFEILKVYTFNFHRDRDLKIWYVAKTQFLSLHLGYDLNYITFDFF